MELRSTQIEDPLIKAYSKLIQNALLASVDIRVAILFISSGGEGEGRRGGRGPKLQIFKTVVLLFVPQVLLMSSSVLLVLLMFTKVLQAFHNKSLSHE